MAMNRKSAKTIKLSTLQHWLDQQLAIGAYPDRALNGLQVGNSGQVTKIAVAVDAAAATISAAQKLKADMLIVHHGLFWGEPAAVVGPMFDRIKALMTANIALYAAHLPLDAHPKWGNNIILAKKMGLRQLKPFGRYGESIIGYGGQFDKPSALDRLGKHLSALTKVKPKLLGFGPKRIRKIAVVSGGGGSIFQQAHAQGYDTYLTGEFLHQDAHLAQELGINIIAGGHYATETFGVKALGQAIKRHYSLPVHFVDQPTGL